ncbi:OmpH family outer membrane protein [Granulicella sp. 5B5]|uniref:OmpH family outer membrane protein n=1 Tax=Granulicella sp. 5B5 TaxID=1617967 RepID=UPI0015F4F506|nr:OmpH family outer membrane protein [Granulicella sp. 5B5]QMV18661.1 OmpH family outer membrane protein [Granulicella sp. 5B5]
MKRIFVFATALAAGLATSTLAAQAPAAAPAAAAVAPQAVPAKIAIIAFEEAVVRTNEGQRAVADIQKKYEPKKSQIDTQAKEVDTLKAQLQALPANAPDDQRATLIKNIDTKEKNLQRDAEDAQNSYQSDLQEAYGKVAQKVGGEAVKYVQANGFTLLLNVGGNQQAANPVLWALPETDITQAVVNAYNKVSGIAAPPPSAPVPARRPATPPSK